MKRYRIYFGPCIVQGMAARLMRAGFRVVCIGTENVFIETLISPENIVTVMRKRGAAVGLRDIYRVGEVSE